MKELIMHRIFMYMYILLLIYDPNVNSLISNGNIVYVHLLQLKG
jgi:hypothetical protein